MGLAASGLRIGVDASRAYVDRPTGTESYSYHLTNALLELDRPHSYTLYIRGRQRAEHPAQGDAMEGSPWRYGRSPGRIDGQRCSVREIGPNRLWTHVGLSIEMIRRPPDVLFVPAHVLPVYRPKSTVVTVHDLGYLFYPAAHSRLSWWYLHLSTAFHALAATRIIADSAATKRDLVKYYHAEESKIAVVHLAFDDSFRPVRDEAALQAMRDRYCGGKQYLLHLGTLQPRKNIERLLEAYAILRRETPGAPGLVVAGKRGWQSASIFARAEALGLGDAVRFVDYVPRSELPALLSAAVALVSPSLYEGFGLPALEAMACGTAVVAADNSSLPEVIGDAGILVNPHDTAALAQALERVVTNAGLRDELAARGISRAAAFTWSRCAEETLAVIEQAA